MPNPYEDLSSITVQRLTRDQATAITAVTGVTAMPFGDFTDEVGKKIPGINTLGLASSANQIKRLYQKEFEDTLISLTFEQTAQLSVIIGEVLFPTKLIPKFRELVKDQTGYNCPEKVGKDELKTIKGIYGKPLLDAMCYTEDALQTTVFQLGDVTKQGTRQKMS
jgi:hypothetical protein